MKLIVIFACLIVCGYCIPVLPVPKFSTDCENNFKPHRVDCSKNYTAVVERAFTSSKDPELLKLLEGFEAKTLRLDRIESSKHDLEILKYCCARFIYQSCLNTAFNTLKGINMACENQTDAYNTQEFKMFKTNTWNEKCIDIVSDDGKQNANCKKLHNERSATYNTKNKQLTDVKQQLGDSENNVKTLKSYIENLKREQNSLKSIWENRKASLTTRESDLKTSTDRLNETINSINNNDAIITVKKEIEHLEESNRLRTISLSSMKSNRDTRLNEKIEAENAWNNINDQCTKTATDLKTHLQQQSKIESDIANLITEDKNLKEHVKKINSAVNLPDADPNKKVTFLDILKLPANDPTPLSELKTKVNDKKTKSEKRIKDIETEKNNKEKEQVPLKAAIDSLSKEQDNCNEKEYDVQEKTDTFNGVNATVTELETEINDVKFNITTKRVELEKQIPKEILNKYNQQKKDVKNNTELLVAAQKEEFASRDKLNEITAQIRDNIDQLNQNNKHIKDLEMKKKELKDAVEHARIQIPEAAMDIIFP